LASAKDKLINFSWIWMKVASDVYVIDKAWAADLYLIYKLEPKARVCISDKGRMRMFLSYLKNDPSYEYIGEVILKINFV
jgi:hypothetical protein